MKKLILISLSLIALLPSGMAQLIPLLPSGSKNELLLDPNRIYSYNQYEKSRWGLGVQYDINFSPESKFKTLSLSGYGAYGYADERFKWGVKADLQSNGKRQSHSYVEFFHDLTADGSRYMNAYQIFNFTSTGSFMTRHFSDTWRLTVGFSRQATASRTECFELRLGRERYLHDGNTLYYPPSYSDLRRGKPVDYAEGRIVVSHTSGLRGELMAGFHTEDHLSNKKLSDPDAANEERPHPYFRLLLQYGKEVYFSVFELDVFAQGGFANWNAPYSRLFDLGGTWGSPVYMEHSLLTARPNEFTANLFTLASVKLTTQKPLFRWVNDLFLVGTAPSPFLLANVAWGKSNGAWSPDKGIAEVGAGVDGIMVWGAVRWGGAVVYRLTPSSAAYHLTETKDNLTFLLTAKLDI